MASGITALTELYGRIMPELPGISRLELAQCVLDVVRDFCTVTECWLVDLTQNLVADQAEYTLAPTQTEADISRIESVVIGDDTYALDVDLYEFDGVNKLTLDDSVTPVAADTDGLVTSVILVPKLNATAWDTGLMNRWADAIVYGVKARLMDNDKESWGNPRRAQTFKGEYLVKVSLAKGEVYRRFKTGSLTVTTRSWL